MNTAILLAAGKSTRTGENKLWTNILGRPLWTLSYEKLLGHKNIDEIILVMTKKDQSKCKKYLSARTRIAIGGKTRIQSFLNAIKILKIKDSDIILDHNAANPHLSNREIEEVIKAAKKDGAAAVSHAATDTIIVKKGGYYDQILNRDDIRLMQTPQAIRGDILKKIKFNNETDLCSAALKYSKVKIIEAEKINKKITFKEDINAFRTKSFIAEDSHRFSSSGTLMLAGLKIKTLPALEANSDGDVVLHAIGRTLAQAKDKSFSKVADALCKKEIKDSRKYLEPFLKDTKIKMLSIHIECQKPKIDALDIKSSLSRILKIPRDLIRVSAMSGEGLTEFGRGNGIKCTVVITVL